MLFGHMWQHIHVSKRVAAVQGLPVVRTAPGAPTVALLARTADEYVHRRGTAQHVCRL